MVYALIMEKVPRRLQENFYNLEMKLIIGSFSGLTIASTIMEAIKGGQIIDPLIEKLKYEVRKETHLNFFIANDEVLGYTKERICVPDDKEIKTQILYQAHNTPYTMHLGTTKMYRHEEIFLVARYKEGCSGVCIEVLNLPTS